MLLVHLFALTEKKNKTLLMRQFALGIAAVAFGVGCCAYAPNTKALAYSPPIGSAQKEIILIKKPES